MYTMEYPKIKNTKRDKYTLEEIEIDPATKSKTTRILYLQHRYSGPIRSRSIRSARDKDSNTIRETIETFRQPMGLYWYEAYSFKNKWSGWDWSMEMIILGSILAALFFTLGLGSLSAQNFSEMGTSTNPMLGVAGVVTCASVLVCGFMFKKSGATNKRGKRQFRKDNWIHLPLGNPEYIREAM